MSTSNVGFATDGYVELEGQAHPINGRMITTPLSGMECVWYRAQLEQWKRSSGDHEPAWELVRDVTSSDPFLFKYGSADFTNRSIIVIPMP